MSAPGYYTLKGGSDTAHVLGAAEGGTVGRGQPDLGSDWHKASARELWAVCFSSKSDLKPSLEVRVCPAKAAWGGEAGSPSTSVLLVLIAELITESAVLAGGQDGPFDFFISSPSFKRIKL